MEAVNVDKPPPNEAALPIKEEFEMEIVLLVG